MAMIKINGVAIKDPSALGFKFSDISQSNSGRTQSGLMYKNRVTSKITLSLTWNMPTPAETAKILTVTKPEYVRVTFTNPETNSEVTKEMYRSDVSTPVKIWTDKNKRYSQITFDLIER